MEPLEPWDRRAYNDPEHASIGASPHLVASRPSHLGGCSLYCTATISSRTRWRRSLGLVSIVDDMQWRRPAWCARHRTALAGNGNGNGHRGEVRRVRMAADHSVDGTVAGHGARQVHSKIQLRSMLTQARRLMRAGVVTLAGGAAADAVLDHVLELRPPG